MSHERNSETQELLKRDIKAIQAKCVEAYNKVANVPTNTNEPVSEELTSTRINNYIEALRTEVQSSDTTFFCDENLLTSQFLIDMKKKTEQVEEMVALTTGNIHDTNNEINRIQTLIAISKEAKLKPKTSKAEIKPEHILKAKEKFKMMKTTLHGLIQSLFPDCHEHMVELMGNLMTAKLNDNPNGYIPITADNYKLMELLKDMNIVTLNPYNNTEVKLTYY